LKQQEISRTAPTSAPRTHEPSQKAGKTFENPKKKEKQKNKE